MKKLNFYKTEENEELTNPWEGVVYTLNSPAILFLNDFKHIQPINIHTRSSIDEVKNLMETAHLGVLSVLSADEHFVGIITQEQVSDQHILMKLAEGYRRSDLLVSDLMIRSRELMELSVSELDGVPISEVIVAMKKSGQKHCLAADREKHRIRGIFSIPDIAEKLKQPVNVSDPLQFYRVFAPLSYSRN